MGSKAIFVIKNLNEDVFSAGYGKMPDYEFVFTDFLLSLARSKGRLGL
jgi:hypothetical protein